MEEFKNSSDLVCESWVKLMLLFVFLYSDGKCNTEHEKPNNRVIEIKTVLCPYLELRTFLYTVHICLVANLQGMS